MTPELHTKMLERVRALLAKADGTPFPEEAESFRAKADQLMADYAIAQWQVDAAQQGTAKPKPEVRHVDFTWWTRQNQMREALWDLMYATASHARCTIALRGYGDNHTYGEMPVIGLASDLDYMDMLFTHLMLQMQRQLHPSVNTNETLGENALRMRSAGKSMREGRDAMAPLLWQAGMLPLTAAQQARFGTEPGTEWRRLPGALQKSLVGRVRRALNEEAKRQEMVVPDVHPRVWQRSFADGFVQGVRSQFRRMRQAQGGSDNPYALALVDIAQQGRNLYDEMWPQPEVDPNAKASKAVSRELRYDYRAADAGRVAGEKADISGHPGKGLGGRRAIGEGR
jgi:hypothetical protein